MNSPINHVLSRRKCLFIHRGAELRNQTFLIIAFWVLGDRLLNLGEQDTASVEAKVWRHDLYKKRRISQLVLKQFNPAVSFKNKIKRSFKGIS